MNGDDLSVSLQDLVGDVGCGLNQIQIAIALQSLLDDLAVQHTEKAAAETKTESV